jgi:hypothetical protein
MHCTAYHFIRELNVLLTRKGCKSKSCTKDRAEAKDANVPKSENNEVDDNDAEGDLTGDDDPDVNVSMNIDASADDAEAMMGTTIIDFDTGDMLEKLLAFINQVHMSSEGVHQYLTEMCIMHHIKPIKLYLWVHIHWDSLSNCLKSALQIQKICQLDSIWVAWH